MDLKSALHRGFALGATFTIGLFLSAEAVHWFITPMAHPNAAQTRKLLVVVQAIVGLAIAGWAAWRLRTEKQRGDRVVV